LGTLYAVVKVDDEEVNDMAQKLEVLDTMRNFVLAAGKAVPSY